MHAHVQLSRPLLAALIALVVLVQPAAAATIPEIQGPITDETGVLEGGEDEIEQAIEELLETRNVQLWVVFVPTTDELPAQQFAEGIAAGNSLGGNDALLLVAIEDRTYYLWRSRDLESISQDESDAIVVDALEPRLRDGDFPGAVVATAEALGEATASGDEPATGEQPNGGGFEQPSAGGGGGGILLPLVLIVGGIGLIGWWVVRRRAAGREAEERDRRTGRLAREANAVLIATDERVRDAVQEIGFVEAEYGEPEVAPLRAAAAQAREELRAAFAVRQRLDDAEPETPEQREAMLNEIVARSRKAQEALDKEAARIQSLRDLERDAPKILEAVPARIAALEARIPTARAAWDALGRYAPATRAPVAGDMEEAEKGIEGARQAAQRGTTALAGGNRRAAAREARVAEQGLTGATALLDAVEKRAASASDAEARVADEIAQAEADLEAAREARRELADAPGGGTTLAAAETALRQARAAASAVPLDPIAARRAATEAVRLSQAALAEVRQDAEQHARLEAAVEASLVNAQADVEAVTDFIATHRGSVGRRARTRLAEADRALEHAFELRDRGDLRDALETATRAERLAEQALEIADDEWDQWAGGGAVGAAAGARAGARISPVSSSAGSSAAC